MLIRMGLGSSIKILVQSLYFMTLWTRVLYLGDVMRLLVLRLGTIAWIQDYHLHFYNCRRVSVLGGSWLLVPSVVLIRGQQCA